MKNIIIIVLMLLVVVGGFFTYRYFKTKEADPKKENMADMATKNIDLKTDILARKIDKDGVEKVTIDAAKQVLTEAGLINRVDSAKIIDSLLARLGIKEKQLQEYTSVNATLKAENLALKESDTGYTYQDPYLSIDLHKPNQVHPGLTADVQYNAVLNWSAYWRKSWLLAPKRNYIDFWMSDPRATIQGIKRLSIQADPPAFGIGLDVIGDYSFKYKEFMPGAAVRLRMGRFGVQGGYMYDIDGQRWWPAIRGSYNLIEF